MVKRNGEVLNSNLQNLSIENSFGVLDLLGRDAEIKMMCLDDYSDYEIMLHGTGEGTMDYSVRYFDGDGNLKQEINFSDVAISENTLIYTGTNQSDIVLHVDKDGDGIVDYDIMSDGSPKEEKMIKISDTSYVYTESPIEVSYDIVPYYGNAYQVNAAIKNISETTIQNWGISFDSTDEIINIWNGTVSDVSDRTVIKNAQYNQDIQPGETVTFGFIANMKEEIEIPSEFTLINSEVVTQPESYDILYKIETAYGEGYNAVITITNKSEQTIEDWRMEFDFGDEITNIWNANIVNWENGHYIVENADYNQNIEPNQSVAIGVVVEIGNLENVPENFIIYSITN